MKRLIVVQDCCIPVDTSSKDVEEIAGDEIILAWRVQQRLEELELGSDCRIYAGDEEGPRERAETINDGFGYPFSCSPMLAEMGATGDPDKLYAYLRTIDETCGDAAVVVAHQGVVGKVVAWWLGIGTVAAVLRGSHAGVTLLEEHAGKRVLTAFNDTRHAMDAGQAYTEVDLGSSTVCDTCPEQCRETSGTG